jgi:hypothetical protein
LRNPVKFYRHKRWSSILLTDLVSVDKFQQTFLRIPEKLGNWENGVISEKYFREDNFFLWMSLLKETPKLHTKQFQNFAILEAAASVVKSGKSNLDAIGFGVGIEQIPAALGRIGFKVLATDYLDGEIAEDWRNTDQLLNKVDDLNSRLILTADEFANKVKFENMDMNVIPTEFNGNFDFVWSSCALGHIGGYKNGLDFIINSANLLKPGGIALHTTELDVSNFPTNVTFPTLSLYRMKDLQTVISQLRENGYKVSNLDLPPKWNGKSERFVDREPWGNQPHIRISVFDREVLSVAIRIEKPITPKTDT